MSFSLPETYLIGLSGLLLVITILVGRQFFRTRKDEIKLIKLEEGSSNSSKDAGDLYELASVQLRKRLYPQATATLKRALKQLNGEPSEAKALIENALGFSLAAQNDFKSAVIHYKTAIKAKSDYPVALNNLAFAKKRLLDTDEALELYEEVLRLDPKNKTALREFEKLKKTKGTISQNNIDSKGF
ncbi:tetratricopeptide repeat protein [Prochlorococcus sp. MIT 1223]|uniref:tetratricopeptide repeat protein n=1 Tax=Prochlorococcus sp. MIT 1223 TaxID=3096217 RepID=UPI002A75A824|nr:tetratricopeptide repeat protein [Prochlorococcus sp. MIT 1223]